MVRGVMMPANRDLTMVGGLFEMCISRSQTRDSFDDGERGLNARSRTRICDSDKKWTHSVLSDEGLRVES